MIVNVLFSFRDIVVEVIFNIVEYIKRLFYELNINITNNQNI